MTGRHEYVPAVRANPRRPWKAVVGAAGSAVAAFVAAWIADTDPFTAKEAAQAALLALTASGIVGGGTYAARNPLQLAGEPAGEGYADGADQIPPDVDDDWH